MNENRYAVGVDVGTSTTRVVIGTLPVDDGPAGDGALTIVGFGEQPNQGMRKGNVVDINKVATSLDKSIGASETMSGLNIGEGTVSINGSSLSGQSSTGLITVDQSRPIGNNEIDRVIDAATQVKMSPNRDIIDVTPRHFKVDDQDKVRDPIDMTGVRLEADIYMITALKPYINSLDQVCEKALLRPSRSYVPAPLAAAQIALTDQQKENGSILIDFGHSTTGIVVYDEGDIIDIKVLPIGSNNITSDLAIGLKADLDICEKIKLEHAVAAGNLRRGGESKTTVWTGEGQSRHRHEFDTEFIDEIVEARLEELYELINKELKRIHRRANLPGGAVLTGGGAKLRGLVDYTKSALSMNATLYRPTGYKGVSDKLKDPAWTTALGLLEVSADSAIDMDGQSEGAGGGLFAGLSDKLHDLFHKGDN